MRPPDLPISALADCAVIDGCPKCYVRVKSCDSAWIWTWVPATEALLKSLNAREELFQKPEDPAPPRKSSSGLCSMGDSPIFTTRSVHGECESQVLPFHDSPQHKIVAIKRLITDGSALRWEVIVEGQKDPVVLSHVELLQQNRDLFLDYAADLVAS
jgi:hypothetical protein